MVATLILHVNDPKELLAEDSQSKAEIHFGFLHRLTQEDRIKFVEEAYRVLIVGGKLKLVVPFWKSTKSIIDPKTVYPLFTESSMLHFSKEWRELNNYDVDINCDYDQSAFFMFADDSWSNRTDEARAFAVRYYFDVVSDIVFDLTKKINY